MFTWQEVLPRPERKGKVIERSRKSITNRAELGHKVWGGKKAMTQGQGIHLIEFQHGLGSNGDLLSLAEYIVLLSSGRSDKPLVAYSSLLTQEAEPDQQSSSPPLCTTKAG